MGCFYDTVSLQCGGGPFEEEKLPQIWHKNLNGGFISGSQILIVRDVAA
jgi:hypothetical protein